MSKDVEMAASGIDTVEMARELSRMKANRHSFGFYEKEDIAQEIWLMVNKAAPKYDPERTANPKSFFNVATENAIKNLKRDNRVIDNVNLHDKPIIQEDNSFEEFIELRDLIEYVIVNITPKLRKPLMAMINGDSASLTSYKKTKIRDAVLKILERYKNE